MHDDHKGFVLFLAWMTVSTIVLIGFLALLVVVFGKIVMVAVAGVFVFLVLLGVASDVQRAFQTTRRTRFPLAPDPAKSRIEHRGGWWCR